MNVKINRTAIGRTRNISHRKRKTKIRGTLQTATGSVKGKTTGLKSSVSKTNYTGFDNLGRLTAHQQITDGNTYPTGYTYNLSGGLIEETYPSGRVVKNVLNNDGELAAVQSKKNSNYGYFNYADSFAYDSAGAVTKMQPGNGKWETASYNNRLQVTQIGLGTTDAQQNLLKLEYTYNTTGNADNNGNLRSQKISFDGLAQPFEQTYTYDSLNRLQDAKEMVGTTQTWKQTFSIDRYGNRRFNTDNNNTTTLGSCSQAVCNPLINTSDNRFSSGQGYSYDANGSVTQDAEGKRFGYDAENRQKEFFATGNNGTTPDATYAYDGEGKRVKKISPTETTVFVYDGGGQLVAEYSTQTAQTPQVSYLTQDHLGSPRVITDQNGAVTTRKDYMAFGDEASSSQRVANPNYDSSETRKGYTGYEKDGESGLDFAQARYYNSIHGRFTSVDPLTASADTKNPQTFNRYSYVLNSPYKFVDPLGLISSSTGACGNWCANSDGFSGGYDNSYDSGHRNGWQQKQDARNETIGLFRFIYAMTGWLPTQKDFQTANQAVYNSYNNPGPQNYASITVNVKKNPDREVEVEDDKVETAMRLSGEAITKQFPGCNDNHGGCAVPDAYDIKATKDGFIINITVTIVLPKWRNYYFASPRDQKLWDDWVAQTKFHEEGHVAIYKLLEVFLRNKIPRTIKTPAHLRASTQLQDAKKFLKSAQDGWDDAAKSGIVDVINDNWANGPIIPKRRQK